MPEQKRFCENCRYFGTVKADLWCGEHRYEGELSILPVWSRYDAREDVDKLMRGLQ